MAIGPYGTTFMSFHRPLLYEATSMWSEMYFPNSRLLKSVSLILDCFVRSTGIDVAMTCIVLIGGVGKDIFKYSQAHEELAFSELWGHRTARGKFFQRLKGYLDILFLCLPVGNRCP